MSGEPPPPFESSLTDRQRALIHKLADRIVELRMTTPAILFLESVRPLNYVGSQVMVFFAPIVHGFFGLQEWDEVRQILERRESIGYFLDLIEEKENVKLIEEDRLKAERKAARKANNKGRFFWSKDSKPASPTLLIIFDMDGVIIDSERVHHELERQMFDRLGISVSPEEHASFIGATPDSMWAALKQRNGLPQSVDELRAIKRKLFLDEVDLPESRVKLVEGVGELIQRCAGSGIKMVVASSSRTEHVELLMTKFGLKKYFAGMFGGDLVSRSKPAPDLFLYAAKQAGFSPADCVVIEDSTNGVKAGKAAGMKVVGYRYPHSSPQDLSEADRIVENFLDMPYIRFSG